jgi:hypothetical protein
MLFASALRKPSREPSNPETCTSFTAAFARVLKLVVDLQLIYDTVRAGGSEAAGFEDCLQFFPPAMFTGR